MRRTPRAQRLESPSVVVNFPEPVMPAQVPAGRPSRSRRPGVNGFPSAPASLRCSVVGRRSSHCRGAPHSLTSNPEPEDAEEGDETGKDTANRSNGTTRRRFSILHDNENRRAGAEARIRRIPSREGPFGVHRRLVEVFASIDPGEHRSSPVGLSKVRSADSRRRSRAHIPFELRPPRCRVRWRGGSHP